MDSTDEQIKKLQETIKNAELPSDLKETVTAHVQRLSFSQWGNSNYFLEFASISSYINWIVSLPWNKKSEDILDLAKAKEVLDKNHYGMQGIKDRILEYLASLILNVKQNNPDHIVRSPILCFVGLAGTGKTTLTASIAESLGRSFERIPFGGMGDARSLRGQSRMVADAEPGAVIKKLVHAQTKNSVILLDEIDRVSDEARSDIMGVLVELLDPEQNKAFTDHYIDYPFNLSQVLFITTSNNTTNIATAVLDRLEIIQMPSYTDAEKTVIAKDFLFPKARAQSGLSQNQITIDPSVWPQVLRPLGFDSGIRSLQRTIEGMCRKTARQIVEGKVQSVQITSQNVKEYLPIL